MEKKSLIIGTRGSRLALVQTEKVRCMLLKAFPPLDVSTKIIKTEGDNDLTSPLSEFDGRGAFVRSIEHALLRNEIDVAVHSLKDLPSQLPQGLTLGSVPEREDPRDVIVSSDSQKLETFPAGVVIATGSDRRRIQISNIRPDIKFVDIRGNIETRLKKLDSVEIDAVVLAAAGLKRLGLSSRITQYLEPETALPAPCQGALGIECRSDDGDTISLLSAIDNEDVRTCVEAERSFIRTLGMGCHTPVGSFASIENDKVVFRSFVFHEGTGKIYRENIITSREKAKDDAHDIAEKLRLLFS